VSNIRVKCPKCSEVMEINTRTGKVVKHHAEVKAQTPDDFLKERLKSIDQEQAKREALVAEGRERERTQKSRHEDLFKKVKDHANDGTPVERPLRDIDID
jgi:hypothetical protein